jgi:3-oxoacyl-[acyl-carrier-protein] synthase II
MDDHQGQHRMSHALDDPNRIVITGVGLTSPNGDSLDEFRANLLAGKSGVSQYETRYIGKVLAGVCKFDEFKYQKKKDRRRGTRAGSSVSIYCANEAIRDSGWDWPKRWRPERVGVYIGVTEHGNVETENEIYEIKAVRLRHEGLVSPPQPADRGEQPGWRGDAEPGHHRATLHDRRRVRRRERRADPGRPDAAPGRSRPGDLVGGISESIHTFGIFAGFASQGSARLARESDPKACRPFDIRPQRHRRRRGGAASTL